MTNSQAEEQILAFAERIFRRADGLDEVVPASHRPNWQDRPARFRLYPQASRIPLPSPARLYRTYQELLNSCVNKEDAPSLAQLAVLLYMAIGPLRRKVDLTWNSDPASMQFTKQEYARGSASGGGLYPVQLYLVAGQQQQMGAGVYHYSAAQHGLVPVRYGDWTSKITQSIAGNSASASCSLYLLLSVDFWANCFKYHNFGYHVCSEDVGVMLATLSLGCEALGISQGSSLVFDDSLANSVIGANGESESVFAVVGLGQTRAATEARGKEAGHEKSGVQKPWQRSRHINIPRELVEVHRLTLLGSDRVKTAQPANRTEPLVKENTPCGVTAQPFSGLKDSVRNALPSVLLARRSAWCSMHGASKVKAAAIQELLQFVSDQIRSSNVREPLPENSLQLAVQVNGVDGLRNGAYQWEPRTNSLQPIPSKPPEVWQSTYSMTNYNIDEAACILFVSGVLPKVVERYGARGYRILNAYVGMVAQLTYVGAAASKLDCGAVLGVRAQQVKQVLLLPPDQNVFLAIYLSEAQNKVELFNFQLLPDVPTWKPAL